MPVAEVMLLLVLLVLLVAPPSARATLEGLS